MCRLQVILFQINIFVTNWPKIWRSTLSDLRRFTQIVLKFKTRHLQNLCFELQNDLCKSDKISCKQTAVHSLQITLLMRLWTNNEIYMKLLNLFLLSKIYNLLHHCIFLPKSFPQDRTFQLLIHSDVNFVMIMGLPLRFLRNTLFKLFQVLCLFKKVLQLIL